MELTEYKDKKRKLETDIFQLIKDFEKETTARVFEVDIDAVIGGGQYGGIVAGVRIECRL